MIKIDNFVHESSLYLNMEYYHIYLFPGSKHICTTMNMWGNYEYQKIPMGGCNSPGRCIQVEYP